MGNSLTCFIAGSFISSGGRGRIRWLQVNAYFKQAGEVSLTKTHGRSPVATLNKMIEYLGFLPMVMNHGELYQVPHCHEINRDLCHVTGFPDYGLPVEFLEADMKRTEIL